jgi:hypothetical protein
MYLAAKPVISETSFCNTTPTNLQEPIFTFYNWSRSANKTAQGQPSNMYWPTIAPASIAFYGHSAIPGWNYSLLVPSLKNGMFRLKLKADGLSIDSSTLPTDTLHYLPGLRLRHVTVAPTGDTLFVSVDNSCCAIDSSGTLGTSISNPSYKGYILRMIYLTTLNLGEPGGDKPGQQGGPGAGGPSAPAACKVYPNPAHDVLYVEGASHERKPLLATLYDITGKPLRQLETSDDDFSLDIHSLSPGIYVFRLQNGYSVPLLTEKILVR